MTNQAVTPAPTTSRTVTKPKAAAPPSIKGLLEGEAFRSAVSKALPKHLPPDRFIRVALTALMRTPKLADCDQASFFQALLALSQMGLEPDGRRAHLIPFENRKRGVIECQLIVGYMGLIDLAMRSGAVSYIHADVVCENDEFEFDRGQLVRHRINFREERGRPYAVYSICRFKDGGEKCEVLSRADVELVRARSKAKDSGPWVSDWGEMAKKGLALDTPIPTPSGWKTMEDLRVGDVVFDMAGHRTQVIGISEIKHLPCYRVLFTNGDSIVCDHEHLWLSTIGANGSNRRKRHGWSVLGIGQLYSAKQAGEIVSMPVAGELQTEGSPLLVDPWLLGYWLGNGSSGKAQLTCHEDDMDEIRAKISSGQYTLGKVTKYWNEKAYSIGIKHGLLVDLRAIGVLENKHIPSQYLRASPIQRMALLQGLVDSDGHIDKARGRVMFSNTSSDLIDGVFELVSSLGEMPCKQVIHTVGFGYQIESFLVNWQPVRCPATLQRKVANFRDRKIAVYRGVKSIEQVESVPSRCIAVDSTTHSYLAGKSMVPTHNTAFRRLSKWLPLSAEFRDALEVDAEGLEERRLEIARPVFDSHAFLPAPKFEQAPAPPVIAAMPEPEPEPEPSDYGALDPLAPSQETVPPPPPSEGPELTAEHHELAKLLDDSGISFARLAAWGVKKGWEPGWDSLTSLADLSQKSVQRLLRTKVGLIRELKLT